MSEYVRPAFFLFMVMFVSGITGGIMAADRGRRIPGWRLGCSLLPTEEGSSLVLRICGGFLVQKHQCDRGELRFMAEHETSGTRVTLQLSDYCPLILGSSSPSKIRYWLYRLTQALIHRLVTVRFLVLLYRDYAGHSACVNVVAEKAREGWPL